eukprot:5821542-Prymnesium_polylepis.1
MSGLVYSFTIEARDDFGNPRNKVGAHTSPPPPLWQRAQQGGSPHQPSPSPPTHNPMTAGSNPNSHRCARALGCINPASPPRLQGGRQVCRRRRWHREHSR